MPILKTCASDSIPAASTAPGAGSSRPMPTTMTNGASTASTFWPDIHGRTTIGRTAMSHTSTSRTRSSSTRVKRLWADTAGRTMKTSWCHSTDVSTTPSTPGMCSHSRPVGTDPANSPRLTDGASSLQEHSPGTSRMNRS